MVKEECVRLHRATADTTTELVQLREAELLRFIHDEGIRTREVDPVLDDRRADEHGELPALEVEDAFL